MPQSLINLHVHIIFSTRGREPLIDQELASQLYGYMGGVARKVGSVVLAIGGMPDHVHLLATLGRELWVAKLVREVKARSSRWVHETFPDRAAFGWQAGYGAFTVSASLVERVKDYIARQEEHHRHRTFQDEYLAFLRRHGLTWDDRYVWD